MRVCVYVYPYVCVCVCIHTHICVCVCVYLRVCVSMYVYITKVPGDPPEKQGRLWNMYVCVCKYIYACGVYVCIYTHRVNPLSAYYVLGTRGLLG